MNPKPEWEEARKAACKSAAVAWGAIAELYEKGSHIEEKPDGPSTEADKLADKIIREELLNDYPSDRFGYLTEETEDGRERLARDQVWVIDPIDGTKDFIKKNGNFAIHVGLVERTPTSGSRAGGDTWKTVAAAVYRPALGQMYSAVLGGGSRVEIYEDNRPTGKIEPIKVSGRGKIEEMKAVISNSHRDSALDRMMSLFPFKEVLSIGSIGVKVSLIASGGYDVYINLARGKCKEWDQCAPELILTEAGGTVTDLDGHIADYNREDVLIHGGILASNGTAHEEIRRKIAENESKIVG